MMIVISFIERHHRGPRHQKYNDRHFPDRKYCKNYALIILLPCTSYLFAKNFTEIKFKKKIINDIIFKNFMNISEN